MGLFRFKTNKKSATTSAERPRLNYGSPFAIKEAYNSIRTKLIFTGKGEKCPVFAVTSSLASDGKSTNAVSLAVSIAMAEQRVLLIDADMRKPSVHRYFGLECKNGLSEILAGLTTEIKLRSTDTEGLSVLTAGQIPPNPAELLGSKQLDMLLDYVRQYFDYVIIDTPPAGILSDAATIAKYCDATLYVVRQDLANSTQILNAIQSLVSVGTDIIGCVLNQTQAGTTRYGYGSKYGSYGYNNYGYKGYGYKYSSYGKRNSRYQEAEELSREIEDTARDE